jgi:RHS repeat-associated protein
VFGEPHLGDFGNGVGLGYTGKPYDPVTGLYDYGYRDYQAENGRFTTEDPVRDGANWFAYVNNDPVNWIDPWGLKNEKILIINMPGVTDGRLEGYLFVVEHFNRYQDSDLIGVKSADTGKQLQAILNEYNARAEVLIFAGGHSNDFIDPSEFRVYLPKSTNAYFATCEEGLDKQAIADSLGLPSTNVHFNSGLSWAENSYNFIIATVYNNIDVDQAFQEYVNANNYYMANPDRIQNQATEKSGRYSACAR